MAASSEESRYAQSVMSFMELCADIHPSLRRLIANSKAFRTFTLDLAHVGSTESVALFKENHEVCAAVWKEALETNNAEKKRKAQQLEGFLKSSKRTKLSLAPDKDVREPLETTGQTIFRTSPATNEHNTSHAAEKNIPLSATNCDNSLFVPKKIGPVIQSAFSRATSLQDEAHTSPSDSVTLYASSNSSESDTTTQDIQTLTTIQSLTGAWGTENTGSTSMIIFTPADNRVTPETAESISRAASPPSAADSQLVIPNVSLMSDMDWRIAKEVGITLGSPAIVAPLKSHCMSWLEWSGQQHRKSNIDDILDVCTRFNFDIVKYKLLRYLKGRPALTGNETPATPIPSTWDMSETIDIVNALQIIGNNNKHAKIQRAYAQMKLFTMVQAKTTGTLVVKGAGKHVSQHLVILEQLAKRRAATVTMQDSMEKRYTAAYFAGKRWSALVGWFGGVGSVLIFVTIGIGNSYVESGWNDFQRACFEYIARDLFSIKKLVRKMGDGVLEQYCRFGNLRDDLTSEIKRVEGYC